MAGLARLGLLLLTLPLWAGVAEARAAGEGAVVLISTKPSLGGMEISAQVLAYSAGQVSAEMVVSRSGQAGKVTTRQGGDFVLAAGETGTIATVAVSFEYGDSLAVSATATRDGVIVARSEVSVVAGQ